MAGNYLGKKILRLRSERGLTQKELADKVGIVLTTLQAIEYGTKPRLKTLLRLADALGVDVTTLDPSSALPPPEEPTDPTLAHLQKLSRQIETLEAKIQSVQPQKAEGRDVLIAYLSASQETKEMVETLLGLRRYKPSEEPEGLPKRKSKA